MGCDWHLEERVKTSAGRVAAGQAGKGPPLVLAHGWPWSSYAWHRLIPSLAKTHRVYWYDMPGYGQSNMCPDQATGLDIQGIVFREMLAHWGVTAPTVIAHDFGGATVLRAGVLHNAVYDRLVLMNVVAMRPWGSAFFDHVGRHVDAFSGLPVHIHTAVVEAYIKGALAHPVAAEDLSALVAPWVTETGQTSFYRQFAQADERFTAEIEPHYGDLRCPVHILWGADDPWIPLDRGRALHAAMPKASFQELVGAGHLPQLEKPQSVLCALAKLL